MNKNQKTEPVVDLMSWDLTEEDLEFDEFDSAKYLTNKETIAAYLSFALESGDPEHFKGALRTAFRAAKMANLDVDASATSGGACRALKPGNKPKMQTILDLLDALGLAIQIVPKETTKNIHGTAHT